MRRKDLEIAEKGEMERIIAQARVCHLAMIAEGEPYVVPLSFGYENGCLYFHSATDGRKIRALKADNRVCFTMYAGEEIKTGEKACDWGYRYKSVIGTGRAGIITENIDKIQPLKAIMQHNDSDKSDFDEKLLNITTIIKVEIDSISGKKNGY